MKKLQIQLTYNVYTSSIVHYNFKK